jgi:hypothetical protein
VSLLIFIRFVLDALLEVTIILKYFGFLGYTQKRVTVGCVLHADAGKALVLNLGAGVLYEQGVSLGRCGWRCDVDGAFDRFALFVICSLMIVFVQKRLENIAHFENVANMQNDGDAREGEER